MVDDQTLNGIPNDSSVLGTIKIDQKEPFYHRSAEQAIEMLLSAH